MARIRPARPCGARRTNGEPCRNFAMLGGRVCHAHGGRAPQVRQAARRRLTEAAVMNVLARERAYTRTREAAMAPWAPAIRAELMVAPLDPAGSARQLRAMAREMETAARAARSVARGLVDTLPSAVDHA